MNRPTGLPTGACDSHVHVIGNTPDYPMVAQRHYTPGPASVNALRQHLMRSSLERTVLIQPSFYGTDNRCMLQALRELQGTGRGVAVLDRAICEQELHGMHCQGVRGLRLNLESSDTSDTRAVTSALAYWAERIAGLGWHIEIFASLEALADALPVLQRLPVPIVLDHFAMVSDNLPPDDARAKAVCDLVQSGCAYVKLSAPYRVASPDTIGLNSVSVTAARYLQANPERVLWGSDWPHTNREPGKSAHEVSSRREVGQGELLLGIDLWLPTAAIRAQVLVTNPARLYGF